VFHNFNLAVLAITTILSSFSKNNIYFRGVNCFVIQHNNHRQITGINSRLLSHYIATTSTTLSFALNNNNNNSNIIPKRSSTMCPPAMTNAASSAKAQQQSKQQPKTIRNLINGKIISETILTELKEEVLELQERYDKTAGLAVLLIGSRRDSQTYVNMKQKACEKIGIRSYGYTYEDNVTQDEIVNKVKELNEDDNIHGILIQLPLPSHLDEDIIINTVTKDKDVDGLTKLNIASLCSTNTHVGTTKLDWNAMRDIPFHIACTPQGCIELLDRSGIEIEGKRAIIIGRSNLVGMPVSMLLMHRNATITIVHSRTTNIKKVVSQGDIVIAAVGKPNFVKADWLKPGCVVIDVGINSIDDDTRKRGYRLVGDVDFEECKLVTDAITPVPGGVGPMTIAMLLRNTVNACRRASHA